MSTQMDSQENSFVQNSQNLFSDTDSESGRSSDLNRLFNSPTEYSISVEMSAETAEWYLKSDVTFVTEVERPSTNASLGPLEPATLHFVQVQAVSADGLLSAPSGLYFHTGNTDAESLFKTGNQASGSARKPKARSNAERKSRVRQKETVPSAVLLRSAASHFSAQSVSLYSAAPLAFPVLVHFALLGLL